MKLSGFAETLDMLETITYMTMICDRYKRISFWTVSFKKNISEGSIWISEVQILMHWSHLSFHPATHPDTLHITFELHGWNQIWLKA